MKRYWIYGYLTAYLGSQFHEALHWLIACILGVSSIVGMVGINIPESTPKWQFIFIASAGGLITIAFAIIGVLLYRSQNLFVKQMGFILVFINAIGRLLYELTSVFAGATDETGIAYRLGIPDSALRIPLTLICILSLIHVIRKNDTLLRTPARLIILFLSLLVSMTQILLTGSLVNLLQTRSWLFEHGWLGYVPAVALINLIYVVIFALIVRHDGRIKEIA